MINYTDLIKQTECPNYDFLDDIDSIVPDNFETYADLIDYLEDDIQDDLSELADSYVDIYSADRMEWLVNHTEEYNQAMLNFGRSIINCS